MEETKDFDIEPNADRLHKAKPLDSLPDCTKDCRMWLEMLRKDFSIPPSNIAVFASQENYDQIVGSKLWDENSYDFEEKRDWPRLVPEESLAKRSLASNASTAQRAQSSEFYQLPRLNKGRCQIKRWQAYFIYGLWSKPWFYGTRLPGAGHE